MSKMAAGKKVSKPVFKTDIPFTETRWPQTSPQDQVNILDLLCNLLDPLGQHRKTHLPPSKGKKRKRKTPSDTALDTDLNDAPTPTPPLGKHLLIGLNSITRHLSDLAAAAKSAPNRVSEPKAAPVSGPSSESEIGKKPTLPKINLLILPTLTPHISLAHAHLPTLLYLSSPPSPHKSTSSRLVTLPPASESRLASALHIPRVGALAILEGAPGAESLVDYVREKVDVVECKWIEEGLKAEWKGVKGIS